MNQDQFFKRNKELWNQKTPIHVGSEFYDMDAFKKGANTLNQIELDLLGDVSGKRILHLQCHFGQDTLSLARMGAKVCGVDMSSAAIAQARELSHELGLDAEFVESNVLELQNHHKGQYDMVFTSYGTITWLPDLDQWASVVNHFLKPGGQFIIAEFHPFMWSFDDDLTQIYYNYFNDGVISYDEEGTYADREVDIKNTAYVWNHSLSEVFTALRKQGLTIDVFQEFDYSPYNIFRGMVERKPGEYIVEKFGNKMPLVYALTARKH